MHCWARWLMPALVVLLGTGAMMSACGQKGPLYLPEQAPASDGDALGSPPIGGDVPQPGAAADAPPPGAADSQFGS